MKDIKFLNSQTVKNNTVYNFLKTTDNIAADQLIIRQLIYANSKFDNQNLIAADNFTIKITSTGVENKDCQNVSE